MFSHGAVAVVGLLDNATQRDGLVLQITIPSVHQECNHVYFLCLWNTSEGTAVNFHRDPFSALGALSNMFRVSNKSLTVPYLINHGNATTGL